MIETETLRAALVVLLAGLEDFRLVTFWELVEHYSEKPNTVVSEWDRDQLHVGMGMYTVLHDLPLIDREAP